LRHLRTKIIAGILVTLPIGITFLVLKFVFNVLDNILGPLIPEVPIYLFHRLYDLPGLGVVAFFFLLYLVGVIATNVLGRRMVHWTDRLMINIPVVKNIYSASKQLADAFSTARKGAFRQAVFVEFPQPGTFVIGFVTNEMKDIEGQTRLTVFVPTAMVPPTGFLLFLPREKVVYSRLTIEEAIKAVMSVGIVAPSTLPISLSPLPSGKPSEQAKIEHLEGRTYLNPKIEGGS
jgi:uncharacterized membrane protein